MYGLVNRAIKDCILDGFETRSGRAWRSTTDASHYVSMTRTPTRSRSRSSERRVKSLRPTRGRCCAPLAGSGLNTANLEYGDLMALGGADLKTFLINLDQITTGRDHLPESPSAPSPQEEARTSISSTTEVSETVSASSWWGSFKGSANTSRTAEQVQSKAGGDDHDVFRLDFST